MTRRWIFWQRLSVIAAAVAVPVLAITAAVLHRHRTLSYVLWAALIALVLSAGAVGPVSYARWRRSMQGPSTGRYTVVVAAFIGGQFALYSSWAAWAEYADHRLVLAAVLGVCFSVTLAACIATEALVYRQVRVEARQRRSAARARRAGTELRP